MIQYKKMKNKSWKFLIVYFLIFQITITSVGFVFAESEVIPKTPLVDTSAAAKTSSSSIKNISKKFLP